MKRKNNVNNINLKIDRILANNNAMRIEWTSDVGFGQYDINFGDDGKIIGRSETMDSNEDKEFLKKLLSLMVDKINIAS